MRDLEWLKERIIKSLKEKTKLHSMLYADVIPCSKTSFATALSELFEEGKINSKWEQDPKEPKHFEKHYSVKD